LSGTAATSRAFAIYKILGVPAELVEKRGADGRGLTAMFQRVDRLKGRPEGFSKTDAPMFYGKLRGDPRVKLHGMSGGPILGFETESGRQRYWLVAMQVGEYGQARTVTIILGAR